MSAPILIMGATSGIGKCALEEALSRGIPVRAFARSAADLPEREGLERVSGDALDPQAVSDAVIGTQAVIYALGIRERLAMLWEKETLFSESTNILLTAMEAAGIKRLVAVTGFGAGRSADAMSSVERMGHRAILGRPYADKDRQEELIMASALDWTIVRPVILRNSAKTGRINVMRDPKTWRNGLISRADVGAHLIDTVLDGLDIRTDVVISR